ncbi:MAG: aspartate carbamoyltransferase regulatory subunit [Candidatus Nanoarchaeia archaeon]
MARIRLAPIKSGTVIDHIEAGYSLHILKILGVGPGYSGIVSLLMNVPSKKLVKKDVVKIENYKFNENEIYKVAVVAPFATINLIENYKVDKKVRVKTLEEIALACSNLDCKSNSIDSKLNPTFVRLPGGVYVCKYCKRSSYLL